MRPLRRCSFPRWQWPPPGQGWWLPLSFAPVLAGALADVLHYYLPASYQKVVGFQLGVLLFLLLQAADLLRRNLAYCESNIKANVYRQMAYTDVLTGLANRAAFEEQLAQMSEKLGRHTSLWCVCADINDLKCINDTLGHAAGDELIRGTARALRSALDGSAQIYRTGGDEFVMFLPDPPEQAVRSALGRIEAELARHGSPGGRGLRVALGCDRLRFSEGDTPQKLLSHTDALMYRNKRERKKKEHAAAPPRAE